MDPETAYAILKAVSDDYSSSGDIQVSTLERMEKYFEANKGGDVLLRRAMTAAECLIVDPATTLSEEAKGILEDLHGRLATVAP